MVATLYINHIVPVHARNLSILICTINWRLPSRIVEVQVEAWAERSAIGDPERRVVVAKKMSVDYQSTTIWH
jgi:hypothetical protein